MNWTSLFISIYFLWIIAILEKHINIELMLNFLSTYFLLSYY